MSIKQRVIKVVKSSGMKSNVISAKIGVNRSTFSKATNPKTEQEPNIDLVVGLLKLFSNLNARWLFFNEGEMWLNETKSEYEKRCKACEEKLKLYEYIINNEAPKVAEDLGIYKKRDDK